MRSSDPAGDNPGEPYFLVKINGQEVRRTDHVERRPSLRYQLNLSQQTLSDFGTEQLTVTVVLQDEDIILDDEIANWTGTVTSPADGTTSPTDRPTASPTQSPAAGQTRSPTASPTQSPTSTATATPTSTPTSTATPGRSARNEFHVTVHEIVDGDTIEVQYRNGDTADVRLLGVDTPEVHVETDPAEFEGIPDTSSGHEHLSVWGDEASNYATSRLEIGEEVRIVVDEQADRRGSYDRLLVYLYDDGDLFNRLLLENGYARLYESTFSKEQSFEDAEATARSSDTGLWDFTESTPTATSGGDGTGSGELDVAEIHADADGNDHDNLNDEYVVFENTGGSTLDLSGWTVTDEADHSYTFPSGFELGPGETVTLYTGSGSDSNSELYWGEGAAVWNNGGDTITVTDDSGTVVLENSY